MYEQRRNQNCKEKKKRNHSQEKYDGDQAAKSSSFVLYKKKKIDKEPEFKTLEIREADILFERKASSSKKKKNKEDDNNQIIVHGDPVAEKKKKKDHKEPKKLAQESSDSSDESDEDSEEEPTKTLKKTAESDAKEFLILMDNLTKLHSYTKVLSHAMSKYFTGFVDEKKGHLFMRLVHSRNILTAIRLDMNSLLAELNNRSVFYASKNEHLENIEKFMYRKVVQIIEDDPLKRKKLIESAQKKFLYVAN